MTREPVLLRMLERSHQQAPFVLQKALLPHHLPPLIDVCSLWSVLLPLAARHLPYVSFCRRLSNPHSLGEKMLVCGYIDHQPPGLRC